MPCSERHSQLPSTQPAWRKTVVVSSWMALCVLMAVVGARCDGGDLANALPAPPEGSPGFPSRDPDLDALPGFQNPPPGYGEVPFWWWTGDPLDKERLLWQIEQLHEKGISGMQVNYAHEDSPGLADLRRRAGDLLRRVVGDVEVRGRRVRQARHGHRPERLYARLAQRQEPGQSHDLQRSRDPGSRDRHREQAARCGEPSVRLRTAGRHRCRAGLPARRDGHRLRPLGSDRLGATINAWTGLRTKATGKSGSSPPRASPARSTRSIRWPGGESSRSSSSRSRTTRRVNPPPG